MNKSNAIVAGAALALVLAGFLGPGMMSNGGLPKASAQLSGDPDSMNRAYAQFKATSISSASERGEHSAYALSGHEQKLLAGEKMSHNIVFVGSEQFVEGSDQVTFVSSESAPEMRYVVSSITAQGINYGAFQQLVSSGQEITTASLAEARKNLLESKYPDGIPEPMKVDLNALYEKFKAEQAAQNS